MTDVGMNRGIQATANGMLSTQRMLDVVANNLANASTTGFKRDVLSFSDTFRQEVRSGEDDLTVGTIGGGPDQPVQATSFESGSMRSTGNPLDVAIGSPNGMFAVQTPQGTLYTRNGSFHLDTQGVVVNGEGHPVLDESKMPIQLPPGAIEITAEGAISVDGLEVGKLGVFDGTFSKAGANLFAGTGVQASQEPNLMWKTLEDSNVNPIGAMIEMITLGRSFELAQKSIQSQDEQTEKLIQSLQDR